MITTYDADEIDRLVREGSVAEDPVWLVDNCESLLGQLGAAKAEIERLTRDAWNVRGQLADEQDAHSATRAEVERMRPVVEAAIALIPEWRDTSGSATNHDAIMERGEALVCAAEQYRAARGKAGG